MKTDLPKWLTITEAARIARISEDKIHKLIRNNLLAAVDIGRGVGRKQLRITPEAFEAFQRRLTVKPSVARPRPQKRFESPTVTAFLDQD